MSATILLPLDGSDKDGRALAVAADVASLAHAAVHVVRVMPTPARQLATEGPLAILDGVNPTRAELEAALEGAAGRLAPLVRAGVTWSVVEDAEVSAAILRVAEDRDVTAIVLATTAPGTLDRLVHASVADRVVRESKRPVVLVPPGARDISGKQVRLRRILVPLDGSTPSLAVIGFLERLPGAAELELILLHVARRERTGRHALPPVDHATAISGEPAGWIHVQAEQAQRHLDQIAATLRARGTNVAVRVLESVDPAGTIVEAIREEPVDAIAMTTRGAGGARRAAHGSVATTVVHRSEVPVLLLTPLR
jgi:nucleotide-binding universal stress UspA family protein